MLYSFMAFAGNIRRMFNMTAKMAAIFTYTYTSTVNLLSPRLFHFHLIHTFPLFSLCVCVYPPPPPSSFSLADCRCVNTCWKEVWQWARRWMQSRLVNNALWHSSVGECSVFCSALTPPPTQKKCSVPTPPTGPWSCSLPGLCALSLIPLHHHLHALTSSSSSLFAAILTLAFSAPGENGSSLSALIHPSVASSRQSILVFVFWSIICFFSSPLPLPAV